MMPSGTMHEWFRFLDADTDEEAISELRRFAARLDSAYDEVEKASRGLINAPGGEVNEGLRWSRTSLSEVIEMLIEVVSEIRSGEQQSA